MTSAEPHAPRRILRSRWLILGVCVGVPLLWVAFSGWQAWSAYGDLVRFGDMNWRPYEILIKQVEGGEVPVDREMITPVELARARQLVPVYSHNFPVEASQEAP